MFAPIGRPKSSAPSLSSEPTSHQYLHTCCHILKDTDQVPAVLGTVSTPHAIFSQLWLARPWPPVRSPKCCAKPAFMSKPYRRLITLHQCCGMRSPARSRSIFSVKPDEESLLSKNCLVLPCSAPVDSGHGPGGMCVCSRADVILSIVWRDGFVPKDWEQHKAPVSSPQCAPLWEAPFQHRTTNLLGERHLALFACELSRLRFCSMQPESVSSFHYVFIW